MLEFQNSGKKPGAKVKKSTRDLKEEIRPYESMGSASLHQENAVTIIIDQYPLVCWGEHKYGFPLLSHVARTILVILAEPERHFSGAGRIAHKDCSHLKDDAVESSVIFYEGDWHVCTLYSS